MRKFFKKLIWLVKHQEELEKLLSKPKTQKYNDGTFSLIGVPEHQRKHIESLFREN